MNLGMRTIQNPKRGYHPGLEDTEDRLVTRTLGLLGQKTMKKRETKEPNSYLTKTNTGTDT